MKLDFTAKCEDCSWRQVRRGVNRRTVTDLMGLYWAHTAGKDHVGFFHVISSREEVKKEGQRLKEALWPGGRA